MSLPLPSSLSPSKVSSFKDCALAFRFSAIDRLPEPPSPWATKGTLVHRALQLLFWDEPAGSRTLAAALAKLETAKAEMTSDPEFTGLALDDDEAATFFEEASGLVRKYFELEDPNEVRVLGVELKLEARVGGLLLRGIIDRLELDADGELVITDYKTGRSPRVNFELSRMAGVHFYAFLCEQVLGRRPARIQLLHLAEPVAISLAPSEQSMRGLRNRTAAVWAAVERACATEDFRPRVGKLCDFCAYKAYCPAFGGDLSAVPRRDVELVGVA
ncbi:MAG TPA: PD-(D/E)XK nuclease family protein [Acidimicrobiales bacterium]|nr:PD-(D/E)XK nuclease family protein [Acidimicrobiales bacterium]